MDLIVKRFPALKSIPLQHITAPLIKKLSPTGVLRRVTHIHIDSTCSPKAVKQLCSSADLQHRLVGLSWERDHKDLGLWLRSFPKLQELSIGYHSSETLLGFKDCADLAVMSRLTKLKIPFPDEAGGHVFFPACGSALTNLRSLWLNAGHIETFDPESLQQVTQVVSLTELVLEGWCDEDDPPAFTWLVTLTNLRSFTVGGDIDGGALFASKEAVETLGRMTWIDSLELFLGSGCDLGLLSSLTGLTRLGVWPYMARGYSLGSFSVQTMANLQCLRWDEGPPLSAAALSVLRSATRLTRLTMEFVRKREDPVLELGGAIARLTNLQHLDLKCSGGSTRKYPDPVLDLGGAIARLINLESLDLEFVGGPTGNLNLVSVTGLTRLRHLSITSCRLVTRAHQTRLLHLTHLTRLTHLGFEDTGVCHQAITEEFRRSFDVRRVACGLSPINIYIGV
jgi:hypothetical protein